MYSTSKLALWRLSLLDYKIDFNHQPGNERQTADTLADPSTSNIDMTTIEDDVSVLCITHSSSPRRRKGAVSYTQGYDINDDTENFRLLKLYATKTLSNLKNGIQHITGTGLFTSKRKDSYCRQASNYVGLPDSPNSYCKNGLLTRIALIDGAVGKVVPTSLEARLLHHLLY